MKVGLWQCGRAATELPSNINTHPQPIDLQQVNFINVPKIPRISLPLYTNIPLYRTAACIAGGIVSVPFVTGCAALNCAACVHLVKCKPTKGIFIQRCLFWSTNKLNFLHSATAQRHCTVPLRTNSDKTTKYLRLIFR